MRVNAIGPNVTESLEVPYSQWLSADEQAAVAAVGSRRTDGGFRRTRPA